MKTFWLGNLLKPSGFLFYICRGTPGYVYVIYDDGSSWPFKKWIYPSVTLSNPSIQRFPDESGTGKGKGNILGFIINGQVTDRQFDWFVPDKVNGLSQAGLSRLNQSVEVFVYCILGAQVNVRSSILGDGGRSIEAQGEFLTLLRRTFSGSQTWQSACSATSWL